MTAKKLILFGFSSDVSRSEGLCKLLQETIKANQPGTIFVEEDENAVPHFLEQRKKISWLFKEEVLNDLTHQNYKSVSIDYHRGYHIWVPEQYKAQHPKTTLTYYTPSDYQEFRKLDQMLPEMMERSVEEEGVIMFWKENPAIIAAIEESNKDLAQRLKTSWENNGTLLFIGREERIYHSTLPKKVKKYDAQTVDTRRIKK